MPEHVSQTYNHAFQIYSLVLYVQQEFKPEEFFQRRLSAITVWKLKDWDKSLFHFFNRIHKNTNLHKNPSATLLIPKSSLCLLFSLTFQAKFLCALEDTKIPSCDASFSKSSFVQNQGSLWLYHFPLNGFTFPQFGEISLNMQVFGFFDSAIKNVCRSFCQVLPVVREETVPLTDRGHCCFVH